VVKRTGRAKSVGDGRQLEWTFDTKQPSPKTQPKDRGQLRFKDPDPHCIFIGATRLDDFLVDTEQVEVLSFRELLESLNWILFESAYQGGGRAPYHPRAIVGLILLGIMEGRSSLRSIEELARCDVRAWWLTGGVMPDHSQIGRFLDRHQSLLTQNFFEQLTREILKRTRSDASRVAGDGTVVEAAASRFNLLKQEAAEQFASEASFAAEAEPDNKLLQDKADHAQRVAQTAKERTDIRKAQGRKKPDARVSPTDPEAMVQPQKDDTIRPSYKPSILANEDRIITGQVVDPGNEAQMVPSLVEQSERTSDQHVDEMLLDAGFFTAVVLYLCYSADISLLCPKGRTDGDGSPAKTSNKQIPKYRFRYDIDRDEYQCPAGQRLSPFHRYKGGKDKAGRDALPYTQYRCDKCAGCSYQPQCSKNGTSRTLKRYDHDELVEAQIEVMGQKQAQRVYSRRPWMVEPVFSELRYVQGLVRFRRYGLQNVRLEFALHASAHNLRRYFRLIVRTRVADNGDEKQIELSMFVLRWNSI
jgi:transposase